MTETFKIPNRSLRRYHKKRMKDRAEKIYFKNWGSLSDWLSYFEPRNGLERTHKEEQIKRLEETRYNVRKRGDNYTICSRHCCGNERKHYKKMSHKERLSLDEMERTFKEMGIKLPNQRFSKKPW